MPGAVAVDVINRRIHGIHHRHGDLWAEILRCEVGFSGDPSRGHKQPGGCIPNDLNVVLPEGQSDRGQKYRCDLSVDQQRFGGIADAHSLALRVDHNRFRHG